MATGRPPHPRHARAGGPRSSRRSSGATSTGSWRASGRFLSPVLRPVERAIYRVVRRRRDRRAGLEGLRRLGARDGARRDRRRLRRAPAAGRPAAQPGRRSPAMSPELAFNTSVSFETNTNWQNYSGETGATYLTQAGVLAVRNFTSAATGLAIAIALFRGLTRRSSATIGNYWVDLTRGDPVHPAADLDRRRPRARLAGRPADVGRPTRPSRRSRAPSRPSPSGRSPPRS